MKTQNTCPECGLTIMDDQPKALCSGCALKGLFVSESLSLEGGTPSPQGPPLCSGRKFGDYELAPKPAPNVGGTAQPPIAAQPPLGNPAAAVVPAGRPGAFFGTYRGEVAMEGKAGCPVTITILNYQGELRLALIPDDQKNKGQPSYFTSIGGMTAKGNTLSSSSSSDYQNTSSSYELRGDEITGTISYQEKDPAKGTVKPTANYKVRATRIK